MRQLTSRLFFLCCVIVLGACASMSVTRHSDESMTIYQLEKEFTNVYLAVLPQGAVLIDAGMQADGPAIAATMRELGQPPESLMAIIITHGHADHAGGAHYFQKTFGTMLIGGGGDLPLFNSGRNDALCPTGWLARRMLGSAQAATYLPIRVDRTVNKSTSLAELLGVDAFPGVIVPVPGHTPGTISVVINQSAFVGDLFRGGMVFGGAARHFFMCDIDGNISDIDAFLSGPAKDVKDFYPGHLGVTDRHSALKLVRPQ